MSRNRKVEFTTGGGQGVGYLAVPERAQGGVLVLHAWWGLNGFFKGLCERLANQGYLALAADLHDGAVASSVSEAKELLSKSDESRGGRVEKIVLGAVDFLRSQPELSGRRIGVIGFSMGGAWALWLSTARPDDVGAVVVFYATYPGLNFSKTQASFLGHYAAEDKWEPIEGVRELENTLRQADQEVTFHHYQGTKHWFFEENRPDEYNPAAAGLAWSRTLEFLNRTLK